MSHIQFYQYADPSISYRSLSVVSHSHHTPCHVDLSDDYNSATAVLSGPVSPNSYSPNGNSPNANSPNTNSPASSQPASAPLPTNGYVAPKVSGSTTNDFKYCRCVDSQQKELNTATNNVYQNYLQVGKSGNDVKLSYDSTGAPIVSYSIFNNFRPPIFLHSFSQLSLIFCF